MNLIYYIVYLSSKILIIRLPLPFFREYVYFLFLINESNILYRIFTCIFTRKHNFVVMCNGFVIEGECREILVIFSKIKHTKKNNYSKEYYLINANNIFNKILPYLSFYFILLVAYSPV